MSRACRYATLLWVVWCYIARAQVTYTGTTTADAFLPTGSAANPVGTDLTGLNFGAAGTLVVAPPSSVKGDPKALGTAKRSLVSQGTKNRP